MSASHRDHDSALVEQIEAARSAEKVQALVYRSLAARAEARGDTDLAARFHDLHADEQHHLSRLTARLLELGARPLDLGAMRAADLPVDGWESHVRQRELAEVERYTRLLEQDLDLETRDLLEEILAVERRHATELGGKWTMA